MGGLDKFFYTHVVGGLDSGIAGMFGNAKDTVLDAIGIGVDTVSSLFGILSHEPAQETIHNNSVTTPEPALQPSASPYEFSFADLGHLPSPLFGREQQGLGGSRSIAA